MNPSVKKFFSHKEDYHPKNRLAYEIYTNCKFLVWAIVIAFVILLWFACYNYSHLGSVPDDLNFFEIVFYEICRAFFGTGTIELNTGMSSLFLDRFFNYSEDVSNAFRKTFFISFGLFVLGRYFILVRQWVLKNK